jgi:hypothetical protein
MSDAKFSNDVSLSAGSGISVIADNSTETMRITFQPDYTPEYFLLEISAILLIFPPLLSVLLSFSGYEGRWVFMWVIVLIFLFGFALYGLYQKRVLRCGVNKRDGTVEYFRGGVLGTSYDVQNVFFRASNITGIEMKAYPGRRVVKFQINLVLDTGERFHLSWANLNFSECQRNAEKIRNFINPDLPLIAVDY